MVSWEADLYQLKLHFPSFFDSSPPPPPALPLLLFRGIQKNGWHLQEIMAGMETHWGIYSYFHSSGQFLLGNLLPGFEITGFWGSSLFLCPFKPMGGNDFPPPVSVHTPPHLSVNNFFTEASCTYRWTNCFHLRPDDSKNQTTFIFHFRSTGRKTVLWNSYPTIFSLIMTIKIKVFKAFTLLLCGKPCNSKHFINLIKSS